MGSGGGGSDRGVSAVAEGGADEGTPPFET